MGLKFTLTSTKFLEELKQRSQSFRGSVAKKIVAPPNLWWWYILEFGSAGRQDSDAPIRSSHSGTYPIDPVNALFLEFPQSAWPDARMSPDADGFFRLMHVNFPGIRPRAFIRKVLPDIQNQFASDVMKSLVENGFRKSSAQSAVEVSIHHALEAITASLDENGKLEEPGNARNGQTAAELFAAGAQIEDA